MQIFRYLGDFDFIIDVRSPREYESSHIPNALNLPIFSDSEFQKIGLLYKQNTLEANFLGASLACKNIANIIENNRDILSHKNKILLYCARGGNRSLGLYQVLKALKLRVQRLDNGYKGYRKSIVEFLDSPIKRDFLALCGNTGCGKSDLIKMAQDWSIDLESLCNHYGSSFGFLAGKQPSVKMFQNTLANELFIKNAKILLIENESKKLGNIILPNELYKAYQDSPKILITCSLENRIKRILGLYENISNKDLINTIEKISPYISKNIKNEIIKSLENNDKSKVTEILITKYYDKTYKVATYDFIVHSDDLSKAYANIQDIRDGLIK